MDKAEHASAMEGWNHQSEDKLCSAYKWQHPLGWQVFPQSN